MKKLILLAALFAAVALSACKYDDDDIWESVHGLENRVAALEELCKQMNTNISSLQTIVTALQSNDYVTGVIPVVKDGETIGYTISFTKSAPITIYHGENGENGKDGERGSDGKDGHTPVIGVRLGSDGIYYWTLDGEWLLDNSGNKIKAEGRDGADGKDGENGKDGTNGNDGKDGKPGADGKDGENGENGKDGQNGADGKDGENGKDGKDGITPQLKIEDGYWYVSTDNGMTWTNLGKATGEDGKDENGDNPFFQSVDTSDSEYVVFTLADGTEIKLPTWYAFEQLRTLCNQMNTNINALRAIVEALQNNDYVNSVTPVMQNGTEIGYTITFSKSNPITIYHGQNGKDGANGTDGKDGVNGKDGHTPIVSVRQWSDGVYYWTLDGEWLLDNSGDKIKAEGRDGQDGKNGENGKDGADGKDGITPQLKIENGYWYVSTDNGSTWTNLGKATGDNGKDGTNGKDGDSMFSSVIVGEYDVTFILADGSIFSIPKDHLFNIEFVDAEDVHFAPNSTYRIAYTLIGADDNTKIEVLAQDGLHASVDRTDASTGFIVVTTPLSIVERSAVIVIVSDGCSRTLMKSLNFIYDDIVNPNNSILIVTTAEPFVVDAAGGSVVVPLQTNLNYRVEIASEASSWLRLAPTTQTVLRKETITFTADANISAMRRAFVYLIDLANNTIAQTLCITQYGDEKTLAETIRFADPNFENFLIAYYDIDGDGKISKGEALEVITLDIPNKNITDLTGLEWFTNLISLNVSQNRGVKTLDISKLTALETLVCYGCALADLDLRSNKALKYLSCYYSSSGTYLTRLDVTQNKALTYLNCNNQHIAILDLSQNTELQEIYCSGSTYLQMLKIPHCSKLHTIECFSQKLSTIDLSGCPELSVLKIHANNLVALDLSRNSKLTELLCNSNQISSINLSSNPQLKTVNIDYNPLMNLNLGNNFESFTVNVNRYSTVSALKISAPSLKILSLYERYGGSTYNSTYLLRDVDLSGCARLESLSISGVPVESIDVSILTNLKSLSMDYCTNITALDLKANTKLESLSCSYDSSLKNLDITANLKLKSINLFGTAIESLDLSGYKSLNTLTIWQMPNLRYLNLGDNPYITAFTERASASMYFTTPRIKIVSSYLNTLEIGHNKFQELDVTECPALQTLLFVGQMENIDLSKNPLLKTLTCTGGLLTSLDLSTNTMLETLNCYNNKLRSLDVTRCEQLKSLSCGNNFLETLDVSGNPALTSLNCSPMASLKTVFVDFSQRIRYITYDRNASYIPNQTEIIYK